VALLLPSGDVPKAADLQRHGLRHPETAEGFRELTNGSQIALVTIAPASTGHPAVAMAECRERVNDLLHSLDLREAKLAQKWPLHD
ncbi:unnamed protein product, partial [Symbiodinium microadriaticum]